jgi:hypothetical protein
MDIVGVLPPKRVVVLAALILAIPSYADDAGVHASLGVNKQLRAELLAMGNGDRAFIESSASPSRDPKIEWSEQLRRIQRLKEIIQQYGWPTISLVGTDGASAAWIVVQHADHDPGFRESCVPLIEAAAMVGEAQLKHMACLTDRVLNAARSPQMYGTQGNPVATTDRPLVNARRKAIGLAPLEEYWASIQNGTGTTTCRR